MRLLRAGFHFYIIGIVILTLGIALMIISNLGASPYDSLLVGLYRTFGLSVGSWEIVVGIVVVLGNALADKKRPEYYALLTSFITGIGIDFWLFLFKNWVTPETWVGEYTCIALGTILTGLGIAIYLQSRIAPNPMDRSMIILSNLTGWKVSYSRALLSIIFVIIAFFFDGAIGIGTLINALFAGVFIGYFLPYVEAIKNKSTKLKDPMAS